MSETSTLVGLHDLTKTFKRRNGTVVNAIDHVDLEVARGEFVVLLGPSGCGKTTLLRCVAGLEHATGGRIDLRGECVFDADRRLDVPPEGRRLSMIFQSYAVWPHMTVERNVAFPLRSRGVSREESRRRTAAVLSLVGIDHLARQYPAQLSGGQQQRVALARALVAGDDLILFDEPLSNVDAKVRETLRTELAAMQRDLGFAALYVTHDQDEALELADRVVVVGEGRVLQDASPTEVYHRPATRAVAEFVGSVKVVSGTVVDVGEGAATIVTTLGPLVAAVSSPVQTGATATVAFRPEHVTMRAATPDAAGLTGTVVAAFFRGQLRDYVVRIGGEDVRVSAAGTCAVAIGDTVHIEVDPRQARTLHDGDGPNEHTTGA